MADLEQQIARMGDTLDGLESSIASAESMTTVFRTEMEDVTSTMRAASKDATSLGRSLGSNLKGAMDDLILDGDKLSDVLNNVGRSAASSILSTAFKPVQDSIAGGIAGLLGGAFAKGGAFGAGQVQAFASGGVVSGPTTFGMRGGKTGLMGEAGPEAIMPLQRGPDGKLGVRGGGGGGTNVVINIQTPDVEGFQRSRTQIAAQMSRALGQAQRNL